MTTTATCTTHETNENPISVWVGNLGKYNEGLLIGEWVALPCEDFAPVFERIGIDPDRDEYHIPDWECDIPGLQYSEYADLDELNETAEAWMNLDDAERAIIGARLDYFNETFTDALEHVEDGRLWHECRDMAAVAFEYCEECGLLENMPENLRYYFDYEAYGRDMDIEGTFVYSAEEDAMVEIW